MKRDMDLVREILIQISDSKSGFAPDKFDIKGYTWDQIGYHCLIMAEAGLIEATNSTSQSSTSPEAVPTRLTWHGHEFIENAKNENIWRDAKGAVSKLGDVSFSVWTTVLAEVVKRNLGIGS